MEEIDWTKKHILKIDSESYCNDKVNEEDLESRRGKIEPWLTATFQSEHLSLLAGSGLIKAITSIAGTAAQGMDRMTFNEFKNQIKNAADVQAKKFGRGKANF